MLYCFEKPPAGERGMNKEKVLFELREYSADPFLADLVMQFHNKIEKETALGKFLITLLSKAEKGDFK